MSLNALGLGFMFNATDMASGIMENIKKNFVGLGDVAGKKIEGLDGMVAKLAGGLTATAAGVGGLAATFGLAGQAGKLETALTEVQKVTFALPADMARMEVAASKLGKELGRSPIEVIQGMRSLATQGYETTQILKMIPTVMKGAAANNLTIADSTDILGQALKAFGINANLADLTMDEMTAASNALAMDVGDLRVAFGRLGPGVHSVGGSLTDALVVFGMAKNALGSTEIAATATSLSFERLSNPKVLKMMKSLGVEVLDVNGNFLNVPNVLANVSEHLKKLGGEAKRSAFLEKAFGRDGKKGVEAFFGQLETGVKSQIDGQIRYGKDAVQDMLLYVKKSMGTTEQASKIMMDRFEASKDRLKATAESLGATVGKPFITVWRPIVDGVRVGLDWLDETVKRMPEGFKNFGAAVLVGGSAFLMFGGLLSTLSAAAPLLGIGMRLLGAAFRGATGAIWSSALALWPWYLAAIAVAGIIYAVRNNIGGLGDAWDSLTAILSSGGESFMGTMRELGDYFSNLWTIFKSYLDQVTQLMAPAFAVLSGAFTTLGAVLSDLGKEMGFVGGDAGPGSALVAFMKLAANVIGYVIGGAAILIGLFVDLVTGIIMVGAALVRVFGPTFMMVVDIVSWVVEKLADFLNLIGLLTVAFKNPFTAKVTLPKPVDPVPVEEKPAAVAKKAEARKGPITVPYASIAAGSPYPETLSGGLSTAPGRIQRVDIDYEAMARAAAKQPIILSVDGQQLGNVLRQSEAEARFRGGRRDAFDK